MVVLNRIVTVIITLVFLIALIVWLGAGNFLRVGNNIGSWAAGPQIQDVAIPWGETFRLTTPDTCDFTFEKTAGVPVNLVYNNNGLGRLWTNGPPPVHNRCITSVAVTATGGDVFFRIVP